MSTHFSRLGIRSELVEKVKDIVLNRVRSRGYVDAAPSQFTRIERLNRLERSLSPTTGVISKINSIDYREGEEIGCELYLKRDDLLPLGGGGSKTRKLDYLVQQALDNGASTIITSGAVQSNHCRLTASAAARESLKCHLVLEQRIPNSFDPNASGNHYCFKLFGAHTHPCELNQVETVQQRLVKLLEADGERCFVIPGGGSNALGALGYVRCALEIIQQSEEAWLSQDEMINSKSSPSMRSPGTLFWDAIVTCSGSGGTHTGILAGLRAAGFDTPVFGISVRFGADTQRERIHQQVQSLIESYFYNFDEFPQFKEQGVNRDHVIVIDEHVGKGYSEYTSEMALAIENFARLESILLDPVYTGKGAAGFLKLARSKAEDWKSRCSDIKDNCKQRAPRPPRLLFVHTGGAPSLFHYQSLVETETT